MGYALCVAMLLMIPLVIMASKHFPSRKAFLLSPVSVFVFAWGASATVYLTGNDFLQARTVLALLAFYFSFVLASGYLLVRFSRHLRIGKNPPATGGKRFISALLTMQGLAFVAAAAHLYYAFAHAGAGADLTEVRGVLATQAFDVPMVIKLLGQLRYVNYFAPLAVFAAYQAGQVRRRAIFFSFALACLYPLCYIERSGVLRMVMLVLFAYLYFAVNSSRQLVKMGMIAALAVIPIVIAIPVLRGQAEGANAYNYVAGAWSGFDNFVSGSGDGQVVVLENQNIYVRPHGYRLGDAPPFTQSMTEFYRVCDAVGLCHMDLPNFLEYVFEPVYTNIYTLARTFYQDFGPVGAPFATALFAAFLTLSYVMCISRGGVFQIYAAAYIAYVCVMSVLSDTFLLRDIVFTAVFVYLITRVFGSHDFWFGRTRRSGRHTASVPPGLT
jgi:oligosaccharide repeat unit polymerase